MTAVDVTQSKGGTGAASSVPVWDVPTRLFHWALVLSIVGSWASYEFSDWLRDPTLKIHRYFGYAAVILIVWRLLWGVFGPRAARFAVFVRGPVSVATYTWDLIRLRERPYASHNPLGAYAVLALLGFVLVQSSLGLVAVEHNWTTWGPLSHLIKDGALQSRLTKLHGQFFYWGLLILVGIHVAAALYHSIFRGEPLVRAMVTGRKPAHRYADADAVIGSQWSTGTTIGAALGWLAVSMALFGGVIVTLGGKIFY
ncbi:MAG: cytochrome b/b6 domain-containing protein [Hyphomicrobiaceae bacterium]